MEKIDLFAMREVLIKFGDSLDVDMELVEYETDGPELRQLPYDMLPILSKYTGEEDGEIELFGEEDKRG